MARKEQIRDAAIYYEPGDMRNSFIEGVVAWMPIPELPKEE